jgi:hypothetical protein
MGKRIFFILVLLPIAFFFSIPGVHFAAEQKYPTKPHRQSGIPGIKRGDGWNPKGHLTTWL